MGFLEQGISDEQYNSFTTEEQTLLDLATSRGGGVTLEQAKEGTGLDFTGVMETAESLINKGVALRINQGTSMVFGFRYSSYAAEYETRVKKDTEKQEEMKMNEKTWESVVDYIEDQMLEIRRFGGKFNGKAEELWHLKKAMSEVDSSIMHVGKNFIDYEENHYENLKAEKENE